MSVVIVGSGFMEGQELVDAMASTVDAITQVCNGLTPTEWSRETGCPGWSVHDAVAHLAGLEVAIVTGVEPDHEMVGEFPHVRDEIGMYMERHVDARRAQPSADVLAEFTEVFADRIASLRSLPDAAFGEPTRGPLASTMVLDRL